MRDYCPELYELLNQIPIYAPWNGIELEHIYHRYRSIFQEMKDTAEFEQYSWMAKQHPCLTERIQAMIIDKDAESQYVQFNTIAFELRSQIEILTGIIHCDEDEWNLLLTGALLDD